MSQSKDLFDDSTMTFGEHLEILRVHLIRAILGVAIAMIATLYYGDVIAGWVRNPIDNALKRYDVSAQDDVGPASTFSWEWFKKQSGLDVMDQVDPVEKRRAEIQPITTASQGDQTVIVKVLPSELIAVLYAADPERFPKAAEKPDEQAVSLRIAAPEFADLTRVVDRTSKPITLNVQEAFMMYMKVSGVAGLIVASPWVIYQLWLFVAAGLYPHEKRYVYIYLPISIVLFLAGCIFCFYCVFPFMLNFLLGFNKMLGLQPQIRISEWISFALMLPLVFGISFELPLVMLFMERISIFDVKAYREKRRLAILVISFLSMMLTPSADPMSMILMLVPMLGLYELGILMCGWHGKPPQFADVPTVT
jgi:sec-independent protein translocase protein TatC